MQKRSFFFLFLPVLNKQVRLLQKRKPYKRRNPMKSVLKWLLIVGGVFFVIIVAAILIIPLFFDVNKYRPEIENQVVQATGRSFSLGEDIDLSIFPWVGVKVTDVRFGNPEGFDTEQMVRVDKFEVRLKVMPLLSKKIEVKTFVLDRPEIVLEKRKDGTANWENIGPEKPAGKAQEPAAEKKTGKSGEGSPIQGLIVHKFAITNGKLIFIDQTAGTRKEIVDLNLILSDITLDKPVKIDFSAKLDNKPVSLTGTAGPIGSDPAKGVKTIDFVVKALDQLDMKVKGSISDPAGSQQFDLNIDVASFSPRKFMDGLGMEFPIKTSDPSVLNKVALKVRVKGNPANVNLSDGLLVLDDSNLKFSAAAKAFEKPDITFDLALDGINLDRYLPEPPPSEGEKAAKPAESKPAAEDKPVDYTPLRKLVMDGKIKVGKLIANRATVEDIVVHVLAKNGIITVDPMDLKLYGGSVDSSLALNVQKDQPKTNLKLSAKGIQAGPLIKDAAQKELIEGTLTSDLDLYLTGDKPEMIKQTLNGKGQLLFTDGAIIGIDLADSVRNVKSKLGMGEKPKEKPRTDFAELKIPFTAQNGLTTIDGTSMISPLLRILVNGKVDLPKENLDVRVEPKFVATLKGQGDTKARSGVMVPVLITGNFASPKIRPDLKGLIGAGPGDLDTKAVQEKVMGSKEEQKKALEGKKEEIEEQTKDVKKQLKSVLPGLGG